MIRNCVVGEPGLEILPGKDALSHAADDPSGKDVQRLNSAWTGGLPQGVWTRMDPLPGAVIVNIGEDPAWWQELPQLHLFVRASKASCGVKP